MNEDNVSVNVDNSNLSDDTAMDTIINKNSKWARASGGHSATTFWQYVTDDFEPQKLKSAVCNHCCTRYNHHKKSEQAMIHLNACHAFCKAMNGIEINDRPEWYMASKKMKRANKLSTTTASSSSKRVLLQHEPHPSRTNCCQRWMPLQRQGLSRR